MVRYPVTLRPDDNGTVMVTFPDFAEAQTFGEDEADALVRAADALATIVDGYVRSRRPLPVPSPVGGHAAHLSPLMSAKVELYNAMQASGMSKSALARRLNWHPPQVDRLLNLAHGSQVAQLEAAAKALGGTLSMGIDGLPQRSRVVPGVRPRRRAVAATVTTTPRPPMRAVTRRSPSQPRRRSLARKK
jgi:antitoxin HicB